MRRMLWALTGAACAAVVAGNVILGAMVAPSLFRGEHALDRMHAGSLFSHFIDTWTTVSWIPIAAAVGALLVLGSLNVVRGRYGRSVAPLLLAVTLLTGQWWGRHLVEKVDAIRITMNSQRAQNIDHKVLEATTNDFNTWHKRSESTLKAFTMVLAAGLILSLAAVGLDRPRQVPS